MLGILWANEGEMSTLRVNPGEQRRNSQKPMRRDYQERVAADGPGSTRREAARPAGRTPEPLASA